MARSYIKLFLSWAETTAELTDSEKGSLVDAMIAYARGDPYRLTGNERFVFPVFKSQIDRDAAAYEDVCEKRKLAGSKGGMQKAANAINCYQKQATFSKSSQEEDKDKDKEKGKEEDKEKGYNARARNAPQAEAPTLEDVRQFMDECTSDAGLTIDIARSSERFWNHYTGKGWNVQDWRPLARNWIGEDAQRQRTTAQKNPALDYDQRGGVDYSSHIIDLTQMPDYMDEQQI